MSSQSASYRTITCPACKNKMAYKDALKRMKAGHNARTEFTCNICGELFTTSREDALDIGFGTYDSIAMSYRGHSVELADNGCIRCNKCDITAMVDVPIEALTASFMYSCYVLRNVGCDRKL